MRKIAFILCTLITPLVYAKPNTAKQPAPPLLPYYDEDTRGRDVFPLTWETKGEKLFIFNPQKAAWAAYNDDGERVMTGGASGGKNYCDDIDEPCRTVVGSYAVYRMEDESCISKTFPIATEDKHAGGAPMPYCMFFRRGYAIHGSNSVPKYNASHGCVRVFPDAAKWLNENFIEIDTRVLILPYSE